MGFPHCPICIALACLTFCIVLTRALMFFLLFKEPLWFRDDLSPVLEV